MKKEELTAGEEDGMEASSDVLEVLDLNDSDDLDLSEEELRASDRIAAYAASDTESEETGIDETDAAEAYEEAYEDGYVQSGSFLQELMSWLIPILAAVLVALVLKNYVIINATVPSGSMLNTIQEGDNLLGFRLAYEFSEPERGDIVIFYYPDDESQMFIKRIIGLPGETVVIQDAKIYINGAEEPLDEDYLREEWVVNTGPYEFVIPEDSYLMLGDNRNNSKDARVWTNTYVTRDKIVGKALFIYYPFSHAKWL